MSGILQWFQQLKWENLVEMLLSAAACLACIVFHEVCHGLAAYWMGDNTAKQAGRLTLNPLKHIDIVGLIMLFTVHFGWAKPVPVDMRRFRHPKRGMAITALAGPLGNLVLAALLTPLYALVVFWYGVSGAVAADWLMMFLSYTIYLSIGLAVFNLFPIPPLDGSKVLFTVLPPAWYAKLMRYERYGMILLVVLLFLGVLDTPLGYLRNGIYTGLMTVLGQPVLRLLTVLS